MDIFGRVWFQLTNGASVRNASYLVIDGSEIKFDERRLRKSNIELFFQLQYSDNNMALLVSFAVFSTISVLFLATCCLCRRKAKDRAKKKHFQRLVSDLNAQEKFTLVTPSDDENSD